MFSRFLVYLVAAIGFAAAHAGSYEDFFQALERNDGRVIASLLQRGFDPNTPDPRGRTPLALAMQLDAGDAAEALWRDPQLKVEQQNAAGETALMLAAQHGREDWARRLVERGAAINRAGWAPLHYAASGAATSMVRWLADHGAEIDARAPNGTTPLMMAAGYGAEASVDELLKRGAATAATNDLGLDAAAFARKAGRDRLAERLARR